MEVKKRQGVNCPSPPPPILLIHFAAILLGLKIDVSFLGMSLQAEDTVARQEKVLSMSFSLVRIENIEFGMMNSLIIGLARELRARR